MRIPRALLPVLTLAAALVALIGATAAFASKPATGGADLSSTPPKATPSKPTVSGFRAKIIHGVAYAPSDAPIQVQRAIWAGDKIDHDPYLYGGGHASFDSTAYDCSGSVSYVLHAAGLLSSPETSGGLESWGTDGRGRWITVYTNEGHAFVEIAGIRFDTAPEGPAAPRGTYPGTGPRWRPVWKDTAGFYARHFPGL